MYAITDFPTHVPSTVIGLILTHSKHNILSGVLGIRESNFTNILVALWNKLRARTSQNFCRVLVLFALGFVWNKLTVSLSFNPILLLSYIPILTFCIRFSFSLLT